MKLPYPIFFIYQWLIAMPVALVLTIVTALATIILSPMLPNHSISYFPARWWGKLMCRIFFIRVKTNGFNHLDKNQSYVFVANHQSIFDIFVVYGWIPFIFKWIMKNELRKIPFVGTACAAAGHIFIDRSNPIAAKNSLIRAEKQLKDGNSVVVFPEGTRTYTGKMGKFKRGAFLMAQELSLPIVPVTLKGSFERMLRNTAKITPGTIVMTVHPPIMPCEFEDGNQNEILQKTWDVVNKSL